MNVRGYFVELPHGTNTLAVICKVEVDYGP